MPDTQVIQAAWLSTNCLLLVAGLEGDADEAEVSLVANGDQEPLVTSAIGLLPAETAETDGARSLLRVLMPPGERLDADRAIAVGSGGTTTRLDARALRVVTGDLQSLVRDQLAGQSAEARARTIEFLAASLGAVPAAERQELSDGLYGVRQALRERLPALAVDQSHNRGMRIDRLLAVDDSSFYLEGWLHYDDAALKRLTAVSPGGARAELLDLCVRTARPDVTEFFSLGAHRSGEKLGCVCFFRLGTPSLRRDGWIFEIEDAYGEAAEIVGPKVISDPNSVREAIIDDPQVQKLPNEPLMRDHIYPAVKVIQERLDTEAQIDSVIQYGPPPEAPDVSIVIPLYQHMEHVEVQLSQFADDPDMMGADLIYVLDSPDDAAHLRRYAAELQPIYNISFRVAILASNVGFASACNVGASLARARLLLLLNSDVLPERAGWLSRMRDFYDATPNIGALGPKMLYEDDSIQHAGMHFVPFPDPGLGLWIDSTYYKGMHTSLPAANIARPVPAVSGACLMIDRELWEDVGGLERIYVRGDYEDSHLCLELMERGRENWYLPEAVLYHLEGQSYTSQLRGPSNRFNSWVYSRLWSERIESLMDRSEFSVNGDAPGPA